MNPLGDIGRQWLGLFRSLPQRIAIHDVLAQFRETTSSNHDLGDRFERLICRYLELDPIYAEVLRCVDVE